MEIFTPQISIFCPFAAIEAASKGKQKSECNRMRWLRMFNADVTGGESEA